MAKTAYITESGGKIVLLYLDGQHFGTHCAESLYRVLGCHFGIPLPASDGAEIARLKDDITELRKRLAESEKIRGELADISLRQQRELAALRELDRLSQARFPKWTTERYYIDPENEAICAHLRKLHPPAKALASDGTKCHVCGMGMIGKPLACPEHGEAPAKPPKAKCPRCKGDGYYHGPGGVVLAKDCPCCHGDGEAPAPTHKAKCHLCGQIHTLVLDEGGVYRDKHWCDPPRGARNQMGTSTERTSL